MEAPDPLIRISYHYEHCPGNTGDSNTNSAARPDPANGRWAGYSHLLMARMLELKREPEVVFWVFVFPLLLALGLGHRFPKQACRCGPRRDRRGHRIPRCGIATRPFTAA